MVEDFEGDDQKMDSIIDEFLSAFVSSPIGLDMETKEEEAQPPMPLVNNEEEIELEESYQEEEVDIEKPYKKVEVVREEHKGVELANSLEISLPRPLPSNTTFKWVKFLSLSFTFPLEYGLLETDGNLRTLCGIKSERKMVSGKYCPASFNMVRCSKFKRKGWYRAQLNGSRKLFGCFNENSKAEPPGWNNDDQLEDGCRNKIWDPGIYEDQFWELKACEELHQSLRNLLSMDRAYWKTKHW
ncbi:uncharacterized protein LOC130933294 [Arachis stenosperma]|uniref:uncharacterized protein LOC130933294 n=1 Tax=Arachis stenosperma TaxID=217475 RepID=UPI0025AC2718|nr:uncharacterized protein LOC130933294 [Arachis stenosperma]